MEPRVVSTTCSASVSAETAALSSGVSSGGQCDTGASIVAVQNQAPSAFLPLPLSEYAGLLDRLNVAERNVIVLKVNCDALSDTVIKNEQQIKSMQQHILIEEAKIQELTLRQNEVVESLENRDTEIECLKNKHESEVQKLKDEQKDKLQQVTSEIAPRILASFLSMVEENAKVIERKHKEDMRQSEQKLKEEYKAKEEHIKQKTEANEVKLKREYEEKEKQLKSMHEEELRTKKNYETENMILRNKIEKLGLGTAIGINTIELAKRIFNHRRQHPSTPCHVQDFKIMDQSCPITVWPDGRPNMGVELEESIQSYKSRKAVLESEISSLKSQLEDLKSMADPEAGGKQSSLLVQKAGGIPSRKRKVVKQMLGSDETTLPASKKVATVVIDRPDDTPLTFTRFGRVSKKPKMYDE
ncbi:hypothetical protein M3P05_09870 [Sansalvadorimonas sp. 2012CJ34-2]|uniref:Uncharacterized protein n=1 Tax=Parendozoicomonas callyspongiae TaxID=2942213 RepID=A0ABT0PHJ9_9GAMM|nr:hypothetical protein [Sansalvadorimonas sp. 2012CJ34-2]MCL6270232.1 hypothetical protein [Sansalvadorimonas sp. 2012CJ34-2]